MNKDDVFGDGTVKFTPVDGENPATLTLKGYKSTETSGEHFFSAIYYGEDNTLKIITTEDSVVAHNGGNRSYGIFTNSNLIFDGSGTLTVTSGNATTKFSAGVRSGGNVTINKNSKLVAIGGGGKTASYGIYAVGTDVEVNGQLVATAGNAPLGLSIGVVPDASGKKGVTTIASTGKLTAEGKTKAIARTVKNGITGTGWTEKGATRIKENLTSGQSLDDYKKVQFPGTADYSVISGDGSTWTKGTSSGNAITFKSNVAKDDKSGKDSAYDDFKNHIAVDGNNVDSSNYDYTEGSLDITLKPSYLETLPVGTHTLRAYFMTGDAAYADAKFTIVEQKKSSGGSSKKDTPKKDNVVTCQMAGYPANYAWNEAAKACQPGYVDAGGNFHSYSNAKRSTVPNTSDNGNLTFYTIAMFLMTLVAFITAKTLTEDSTL